MKREIWLGWIMSGMVACSAATPATDIGRADPIADPPVRHAAAREVIGSERAARAVAEAAASFQGVRLHGRAWLTDQELMNELSATDVVCLGTDPKQARDHWAAVQLTYSLYRRADGSGRLLAVGWEAFSSTQQSVLDTHVSGQSNERTFLREIDWPAPPGPDFGYYRPLLDLGRRLGVPMMALGADRALLEQVRREGLDSLDTRQKKALPELDTAVTEHRELFESLGPPAQKLPVRDRRYVAMVLGSEAVAQTAVGFVEHDQPARQLLIVANVEQCHRSSVPDRILRRLPSCRAVSLRAVESVADGEQAASSADFDYALVVGPEP